MDLSVEKGAIFNSDMPALVVGVFEDRWDDAGQKDLLARAGRPLENARSSGEFAGEFKQLLQLRPEGLEASHLLLVGLGKSSDCTLDRLREAAAVATRELLGRRVSRLATDMFILGPQSETVARRTQAVVEGVMLAGYRFDRYRTEKRDKLPPALARLVCRVEHSADQQAVEQGAQLAQAVCRGVFLARDLVNEPGNVKSPLYLAERAAALTHHPRLTCEVIGEEELSRQGFGALLGVARGSSREPCLIVLEYRGGSEDEKPVALIGKGVMFDAGGISLKPAEKMDEMKMDMAGAAAVLGTIEAAASAQLPVNLVGVIPAVENMPSGTAMRPGDVLTSLSGRTIEVVNTDAEGRLILADALTYCARYQPRAMIDLATLTGACVIALGTHAAAVLGSDAQLVQRLQAAGRSSGEKLWEMPLWEEYAAQLKSEIADLKNIGGRPAGTITAAAFLDKFAEGQNWAHVDIAGTAWEDSGKPLASKGATGFGVRLLMAYLRGECELH
jgi:leucyl aminopeptidase